MAPRILRLHHFITSSCRVAATGLRLNDLAVGGCNDRTVLPNRLKMELLALLDMEAVVWPCFSGSDEKASTPGGRDRVSVCQGAA